MTLKGRWDRHRIADLGEKLGMIERAVGYRLPLEADGYEMMREVFACNDTGLSKRLGGTIQVTDFELSRIVHAFGLDVDDVHPDHLLLAAQDFDATLKSLGAGLFGASEMRRFAAAAKGFDSGEARLEIRRVRRGPGFGRRPEDGRVRAHELLVGQRVRFRATGPADGALLVVDHRLDAEEPAHLVSPATDADWIEADGAARRDCPRSAEPMLHVHAAAGLRRVTALWVDRDFGARIEGEIEAGAAARRTGRPRRGTAGYRAMETCDPEAEELGFRAVPVVQLAALTRAMARGGGEVLAVAGCDYRVAS